MQAAHGALALTILGVAIGLLGWWQQPQVTVADAPAMLPSLPVAANVSSAAVMPVTTDYSVLQAFRGDAVVGRLPTGFKGRLVIHMRLRHGIDFHLSAQGEVPLDDIVAL